MTSTRSTIVGTDAVADAARAVSHEIYLGPYGDTVEPAIARTTTFRHLRSLDLQPNMRVLEVGTGSGYAAALMAHIVGPGGHVLTIDSNEALSVRARQLFVAHDHRTIDLGDLRWMRNARDCWNNSPTWTDWPRTPTESLWRCWRPTNCHG